MSWSAVVSQMLPDSRAHGNCEVPSYVYPTPGGSPVQGRYVRCVVKLFAVLEY